MFRFLKGLLGKMQKQSCKSLAEQLLTKILFSSFFSFLLWEWDPWEKSDFSGWWFALLFLVSHSFKQSMSYRIRIRSVTERAHSPQNHWDLGWNWGKCLSVYKSEVCTWGSKVLSLPTEFGEWLSIFESLASVLWSWFSTSSFQYPGFNFHGYVM